MTNSEFEPPSLDEATVNKLARLADEIDGCHESIAGDLIREFNELANTELAYRDFQGIYGGEKHETFVRRVLIMNQTTAAPGLDKIKLIEMFSRILKNPTDEEYLTFAFETIGKTYGDPLVSDLVFWPGSYFGDGDNSRELTAEEMAEAVLQRFENRKRLE